jgi:hypothetical protein
MVGDLEKLGQGWRVGKLESFLLADGHALHLFSIILTVTGLALYSGQTLDYKFIDVSLNTSHLGAPFFNGSVRRWFYL